MGWRTNVAMQAIKARVPFGQKVRQAKRLFFGYQPSSSNMDGTLEHWNMMQAAIHAANRSIDGANVLEIGTGWFPVIPILCTLNGSTQVFMTDLNPHLDPVAFSEALNVIRKKTLYGPKLAGVNSLSDIPPLRYMAPLSFDNIPDRSLDIVISRTVLEHIPENDLITLLTGLRAKLKPDGLMVHLIDHSDHLEHRDKSISKINFLTWSDQKHALVNWLTREGENRLRYQEFEPIFKRTGFKIVSRTIKVHQPTKTIAATLQLSSKYARMDLDELAALESLYVIERDPQMDITSIKSSER